MNVKERILQKGKDRRKREVTIFGEKVHCMTYSVKDIEDIQENRSEEQIIDFLSRQFFDIETGEEIFTTQYLREELSSTDLQEITELFFATNGVSKETLEDLEKNSERPAESQSSK